MSLPENATPSTVPVGVDETRASIARVYDAALGGKSNYAIDRQVLKQMTAVTPEIRTMAWTNRNFLCRAVRFLTTQGRIRQFVDCGSGLPTAENTHEVAQRTDPQTRVIYVDNDPVVLAHGRAILETNDWTSLVDADIYQPHAVLDDASVRAQLDFAQPMALLHVSTLHHNPSHEQCVEIMTEYIDLLPSGSYVVVSHFFDPETPEESALARKMEDVFLQSPMGSGSFRTREQLREYLPGLEIVRPNPTDDADFVLCEDWWSDGPRIHPLTPVEKCVAAAVGRKP